MTSSWEARVLRRACAVILVALVILAVTGRVRGAQPAGPKTLAVIALADWLCPALATTPLGRVTVADGAHRLDAAGLRRAVDVATGWTSCAPRPVGRRAW